MGWPAEVGETMAYLSQSHGKEGKGSKEETALISFTEQTLLLAWWAFT